MSCLTGVDEDEKDADPEMNALTLLQEPVRMAQESISYIDSFSKASPLKQNNIVLDVLSNTDMLSPVGLGNGPSSHRATQAHDLNSFSTDKEEEKSITPLKTVQEIDTAGIWDFDVESPENSLDNFNNSSDLHWDPHKEFMQFLWENHDDSPGEEPREEVPPPNSQRRRKRKMDMVVMVDPSEDLYPDLSHKSSEDSSDTEDQVDSIPVSKVRKLRKHSKSQSSPTGRVSKYPNGTVKAIKQILYNAPARNSHENSIGHRLSPLKGRLSINSCSEEKPLCYPCSKCNLIFKKEQHLQCHMKSHVDPPNMSPKPFICRECGESFNQSGSLIQHMSVHQEKKARPMEEIKGRKDMMDEAENAKLFCPQCPFRTNCPNTFVQHAKTHQKDKKSFNCDKCSFKTAVANQLRRHNIRQHTVIPVTKQFHNDDAVETDETDVFSCNICSYRAFSKNVFKNHLQRRHQQTFEEYQAAQENERNAQPAGEQQVPTCKTLVEDSELTSKISIKNQISSKRAYSPSDSNDISDLFKNNKMNRGLKTHLTESKLDKSINVLLYRQRHGKKTGEQKKESNNCSTSVQNSNDDKNDNDQLPEILTVKFEDTSSSPNGHRASSVSSLHSYSRCDVSAAEKDLNSIDVPKSILDQPMVKKMPSKRKMSTPYRNTTEQDSCLILPKHLPSPKRLNLEEMGDCDEKDIFQFKDTDANTNLFDHGIKQEKPHIIYTYSRRMSMRGALQASRRLFDKIKTEDDSSDSPVIKEECIETEVFTESFDAHSAPLGEPFTEDMSVLESDHKSCPYCPAVFESGVGLSNHVRGHLHRVGLSYNARHIVPPEQVASQDKRPRIRRKMSAIRRLKKALQLESDPEVLKSTHACPLCGDSFDNKTGQSNHIRGHLKRLGKSISTKNKSPLCLLRELMRDKKEFHRALQILGKKRNHFQFGASTKLSNVDRLTTPSTGIFKNHSISSIYGDAKPQVPKFSLAGMASEKKQLETKLEVKGSLSGTSALIGILKKRKCQEDSKLKSSHISRSVLPVSSNSEHSAGSKVASSLPNSISERGEFNRKVCIHCNATFHSGVSLSNHLRAYAKRKRTALLEGTTYDCKARRQRSRPGSKKKTLPIPQTPEEMYRLTCRFCDLVFQGPLSVQEDWIKHLQRHIMNTSVPHTGLGMVEVTSLPKDPPTHKTDQDSFLTATHAAS
ncbi:zinc finger protein 644a [Myripristis murdjan]|uniref:zinc finger protein 644a n=1 Tax=Myripristis murdjan TaxID=586833 RepID=UPI001175D6C7|nr:zinc finger protein 644-like [Myripristis murdjan]XP_029930194.1 zinc finger protein 644-like [Myripristis murdjan]